MNDSAEQQPLQAEEILAALKTAGSGAETAGSGAGPRPRLGTPLAEIDRMCRDWRAASTVPERLGLAGDLWARDIHESRIVAAKLLTQARIPEDADIWAAILLWAGDLDDRVIADALSAAGERRLAAAPEGPEARLAALEPWLESENPWLRRAAITFTRPWSKMPFPKAADRAVQERVLGWAAQLAGDADQQVQSAVAGWIADFGRRNEAAAGDWLQGPGAALSAGAYRMADRTGAYPRKKAVAAEEEVARDDGDETGTDPEAGES